MTLCFFCGETLDQASTPKDILCKYELASGQTINFDEIDVAFNKGVSA